MDNFPAEKEEQEYLLEEIRYEPGQGGICLIEIFERYIRV